MNKEDEEQQPASENWTLLRDIGVFQVKLIVDGLRDLILVPISLIAGIVSFVKSKDGRPGSQFYHLLGFGRQTELWINLFGAVENSLEKLDQPTPFVEGDIDDLVGKFETYVVDEFKRGGLTAQAKERLDAALAAIQRKNRNNPQ